MRPRHNVLVNNTKMKRVKRSAKHALYVMLGLMKRQFVHRIRIEYVLLVQMIRFALEGHTIKSVQRAAMGNKLKMNVIILLIPYAKTVQQVHILTM